MSPPDSAKPRSSRSVQIYDDGSLKHTARILVLRVASAIALCASMSMAMGAVTFTTLFSFPGTNGAIPEAALIQGTDGFLYGTTLFDGSNGFGGTIFRVSTNGEFQMLASLQSFGYWHFQAGLIQANDGNFYAVSYDGGSVGAGAVLRLTPEGVLTTFASFNYAQTSHPNGLVQAPDGNFYGTTHYGGDFDDGTVFRLTTNGVITVLVSFNGTNGAHPQMKLRADANGNLYGTTTEGGTNGGYGTVFRCTLDGHLTSLFSFNGTNGAEPLAAPLADNDGNLYGTTASGGAYFDGTSYSGEGTVYRLARNGEFTNLAIFYAATGGRPEFDGLIQGNDGQLYGVSSVGSDYGSIFRITTNGMLTKLVSLNGTNGSYPIAGLMQGRDGAFYGATAEGGTYGFGTIFRLEVPPEPVPGTASLTLTSVEDSAEQLFGRLDYVRRFGKSHATITIFSNAYGDDLSWRGTSKFTATENGLTLAGFVMHPFALRVIGSVTLERTGSDYTGTLNLVGRARSTSSWNIELSDVNDADADGIPDLSDVLPPVILLQPRSRTVKAGTGILLTSRARGEGPLQFQWRLNGLDIPGATNRTLKIKQIQFFQAGDYRVIVSGPGGTVASSIAQITVK